MVRITGQTAKPREGRKAADGLTKWWKQDWQLKTEDSAPLCIKPSVLVIRNTLDLRAPTFPIFAGRNYIISAIYYGQGNERHHREKRDRTPSLESTGP